MEFKEAVDALGLSAVRVAAILGRPAQSVRQMRLDPTSRHYRPPPADWRGILARYARSRGRELLALADRLDPPE